MSANDHRATEVRSTSSPYREMVPGEWFDRNIQQNQYHDKEINTLRAFQQGDMTASKAAYIITRPVTQSPLPDSSARYITDPCFCLMALLAKALDTWPVSRTSDLIALLCAFKELSDGPHGGQLKDNGQAIFWKELPWLGSILTADICWEAPEDILMRCAKTPAIQHHEFERYINRQNTQAQLTAAGLLDISIGYSYIICVLETRSELNTTLNPNFQAILELQIPAVARWIIANGETFYEDAIKQDRLDCVNAMSDAEVDIRHVHMSRDRWILWEQRLEHLACGVGEYDKTIQDQANRAVEHMRSVVKARELSHACDVMI
jgi:hypothetical protein